MSSREFDAVAVLVSDTFDVVAIDLPGFGGTATSSGVTVDEMVAFVERAIGRHGSHRWMLVGHSMGGKIVSLVASRTLSGASGLFGLAGVALLAASPPAPEPMEESRRASMLDWVADGRLDHAAAREFVDANVGAPLQASLDDMAVHDVMSTSPEAWAAWLTRGSREDRSMQIGVLDVPAVIVAGGADGDLGERAQRALNLPHYARARVEVLDGAGHLLPLQRADDVARILLELWHENGALAPILPDDFAATIASSRTSARTRSILAGRALADDPHYVPRVPTPAQLETLRVLADLVVPQTGAAIDLAVRLDAQLAAGKSDGWRSDLLPADDETYRLALDCLADLADATPDDRASVIAGMVSGEYTPVAGQLSAEQLKAWFDDVRVDLVRHWLAHPATMARIGYDGIANGGDGPLDSAPGGGRGTRIQGFQLLLPSQREGWEPAMEGLR